VVDDAIRLLVIVPTILLGAAACFVPVRWALAFEPDAAIESE
jgi:hypothetical protein